MTKKTNTKKTQTDSALGVVPATQFLTLFDDQPLELDSGIAIGPLRVAYETYGTLNADKSNATLICHALTGGAHAAGLHDGDKKPGWWDVMIGPGKAFDTDRYFIICTNILGGCYGTTGPSTVNPATEQPWAMHFPVITMADMTRVQAAALDALGIESLLAVSGGSMGGMNALQWTVLYPQRVRSAIIIAATHRHSPQQIAFNELSRQSIMADPQWNQGNYYDGPGPGLGLAIARMTGHITYLSEKGMERKFGRRLRSRERYGYDFSKEFEVETYLQHQGRSFVERFDANSLLYLTKAMDYFDLADGYDSLTAAFAGSKTTFLLITFTTDWLYPPQQLKDVARAVRRAGCDATYYEIDSDYGHDAFLVDYAKQEPLVRSFLEHAAQEAR